MSKTNRFRRALVKVSPPSDRILGQRSLVYSEGKASVVTNWRACESQLRIKSFGEQECIQIRLR